LIDFVVVEAAKHDMDREAATPVSQQRQEQTGWNRARVHRSGPFKGEERKSYLRSDEEMDRSIKIQAMC
jgi:hypothetical protein